MSECMKIALISIIIRAANTNELGLWREPPGEGSTHANSLADLRRARLECFWCNFQGFSLKKIKKGENLKILRSEINIALDFFFPSRWCWGLQLVGKVGGHSQRRLQRILWRALDEIDLLFLLPMKCKNMFNGRREQENVSFRSSNSHASWLSLPQTGLCTRIRHAHACPPLQKSAAPLVKYASVTDMWGSAGKLVFCWKRTGQVAKAQTQPAQTENNDAVALPFTSQRERRVGIKVRTCQAFTQQQGEWSFERFSQRRATHSDFGFLDHFFISWLCSLYFEFQEQNGCTWRSCTDALERASSDF